MVLVLVTAGEEIRYTEIIDRILTTADLETVTRKKIRLGLQAELGGKDLNEQRVKNAPLLFLFGIACPHTNHMSSRAEVRDTLHTYKQGSPIRKNIPL